MSHLPRILYPSPPVLSRPKTQVQTGVVGRRESFAPKEGTGDGVGTGVRVGVPDDPLGTRGLEGDSDRLRLLEGHVESPFPHPYL